MSSNVLLRASGISKIYSGNQHPISTLRHALFGSSLDPVDEFKVLSNIDLEIKRGEAVGIMGRNGAGKTTLLGILGNIIQPTGGTIERYGRMATLLGLSGGFNPNFSGRENAYLFCSIQGLNRIEVDERIGGIEDFADLGRYFDMPLHTYSSGMQSRLAFSCAIHVNAELIIIDETLAVGDANFRLKCYDRIRQMQESGQTFLIVSHSQNLIASFCSRAVVLEGGVKIFDGSTLEGLEAYKRIRLESLGAETIRMRKANLKNKLERSLIIQDCYFSEVASSSDCTWGVINLNLKARRDIISPSINFGIRSHEGIIISSYDGKNAQALPMMRADEHRKLQLRFENRLQPGRYFVSVTTYELIGDVANPLDTNQNILSFDVVGEKKGGGIVNLQMQVSSEVQLEG